MKPKSEIAPARRQKLPQEIVNGLLASIRNQFCPDLTEKEWYKDHNQFIRRNVVLWPARFIVSKGFALPANRYEQILRSILVEIKQHGQTGKVRYWPGYLMHCVQQHFQHHWEEYYQEAKSAAALIDSAIMGLQALPASQGPNAVEVMAATHRLMTGPRKRSQRQIKPARQPNLFEL